MWLLLKSVFLIVVSGYPWGKKNIALLWPQNLS